MIETPLTIIMQFCIIIGVAISVYQFSIYVKKIKPPICKEDIIKAYVTDENEYLCNIETHGILYRIGLELRSCKVALMRFHNGGKFANGRDMRKFTTTHETPSDTIKPFMDNNIGVLISRYPIAFNCLKIQGYYAVSDINDCNDLNFKCDMKKYGFKACYLFLIKQVNGNHEGFIGVNFCETTVLDSEKREIVKEQIPKILSLINMVE
jgi:hypothetical protein